MYCKNCGAFFMVKRHFHEILKQRKRYLCSECLRSITLKLWQETVPLDNGYNLIIYHLYDYLPKQIIDYLCDEYSQIVIAIMRKTNNFFFMDQFSLELVDYINKFSSSLQDNFYIIALK